MYIYRDVIYVNYSSPQPLNYFLNVEFEYCASIVYVGNDYCTVMYACSLVFTIFSRS